MIKDIQLGNNIIKYDTETQDGFDDILKFYDRKIITLVNSWVKNIPDHDVEDLAQICRMKLIDVLSKYDNKKANFSTYVYTAWHRKLSQLAYKYKTKKYSSHIENDNYITFNYAMDKKTQSLYLNVNKHKCPIKKQIIDKTSCYNCPHHEAYKSKLVLRGNEKGEKKLFSKCKFHMEVLKKRGARSISLDEKINRDSNNSLKLYEVIEFKKQTELDGIRDINIDIEKVKEKVNKECYNILTLILQGLDNREICKETKLPSKKINSYINKLSKNKTILNLLGK
jgi:RNA polymerase sigma factor (sigma-70 family)